MSTTAGQAPAQAARLQRAGPHHALEPQLLPLERSSRRALPPRLVQPTGHLTQRGEAGIEFRVRRGPHRGHRQRGGAPAFGPGKQQPGPAGPRGMALRERGQFGAARRGLGPQLRRAQGEPMLVQHLEPAAAGGQHPARLGRGLAPAAPRRASRWRAPSPDRAACSVPPRRDDDRRHRRGPGPARLARPADAPAWPRRSRVPPAGWRPASPPAAADPTPCPLRIAPGRAPARHGLAPRHFAETGRDGRQPAPGPGPPAAAPRPARSWPPSAAPRPSWWTGRGPARCRVPQRPPRPARRRPARPPAIRHTGRG